MLDWTCRTAAHHDDDNDEDDRVFEKRGLVCDVVLKFITITIKTTIVL